MTDHVPTEIWFHIAHYIPDEILYDMLGVNRLFFDLAMDARYKQITLKSLNAETLKLVDRLSEPAIAKRVRCLAMRHHHIRNLKSNLLSTPRVIPLRQRIKAALRLPGTISQSSLTISPAVEPISFEDMIKSLTCIFPGLVNLEEFLIDSWNWPAQFNFQPLFSAAWTSFGRNLRRLSLGGNLEGFRVLIDSKPSLDSLQELDLEFTNNLNRADPDHADDESILLDYVAPFINALSPQLQALRIWSWASADLSSMFKQLGAFPMLNAISIRAAFNRSFRHDPSGLTLLLHSCSPTLRDLQLRLNPSGFANPVSDSPLSRWLSATITSHEGIGTGLQSLQLYPSASDVGLNSLITCIGRSTYSMRKLVVRDRYLHHGDIVRLVAAFSSPSELQSLRLNVWALSAPLMDLLSESFPSLKELTLTVGDVNGGEELWATIFTDDMQKRKYNDWRLYDLSIWEGLNKLDRGTMELLGRCIPSLTSFWGEGHK